MAKCEVINLTLSDCDSDGDFIQLKKAFLYPSFCIQHQVSVTSSFTTAEIDSCMYVVSSVVSRSQPDLFALPDAGSFTSR